jgi:hypothetical protein
MNSARRIRLTLLAILLTASQVVLVGHLAAHAQPVVEHCALCASHAQPQAAIPAAGSPVQVEVVSACSDEPPAAHVLSVTPRYFQPRAPPTASS